MRDALLQLERTFGVSRDEMPETLTRFAADHQREHESAEREALNDREARNGR